MTDFTFNAQRAEPSLGLQDFNARYFSPVLGRFLTPDSIVPDYSNPQDLNRYSYVRNSPVRYTDPTGHATECGVTRDDCGTAVDGPTMVAIHRSQQWREENPELVQAMQEVPVSIVCEYCDWAITLNHWRQGDFHWTDTLGLLPVIPVAAVRTARIISKVDNLVPAKSIRWTQKGISSATKGKQGMYLDDFSDKIVTEGFQGTLEVVEYQGELWSFNNRRLTVAKMLDMEVPVTIMDINNPDVFKKWQRHYDGGDGRSIKIRGTTGDSRVDMNGNIIESR